MHFIKYFCKRKRRKNIESLLFHMFCHISNSNKSFTLKILSKSAQHQHERTWKITHTFVNVTNTEKIQQKAVEEWKLEENSHLLHPFLFPRTIKRGRIFLCRCWGRRRKIPKWKWKFLHEGKLRKKFLRLLTARRAGKNGGFHAACMHGMGKIIIYIDTHNTQYKEEFSAHDWTRTFFCKEYGGYIFYV